MKQRSLILLALVATAALLVTPVLAGKTVQGKLYGKELTGSETVALSELMKNPDTYVGKTVRVEGLVVDVCAKRGCWMELAGDQEFQSIKIKVDDGVIVFPMEAKGKKAVAEGVFTRITPAAHKHEGHGDHAHDHAKAEKAKSEPCSKDKAKPCDKPCGDDAEKAKAEKAVKVAKAKNEPCDKAEGEPCDKDKKATKAVYLIRGTGAVIR
jgi:hypothetical protein